MGTRSSCKGIYKRVCVDHLQPHPKPHFPTHIAPTPAGATGFLGSLVLEQLLRCVPGLKQVYVLARGKKGLTAQQRIDR